MEKGQLSQAEYPPLKVVIAGGGTGGHLFPGIALAEAFQKYHPESKVLFVGTGNRLETAALKNTPFDHLAIAAGGLKGKRWGGRAAALGKIAKGLFESMGILRRFRPDIVGGVGGYVSGPVVLAARMGGIPAVLHEQNVAPGLANRMLAPLAARIYVTFPNTRPVFPDKKVTVTGNPVRRDLLAVAQERAGQHDDAGSFQQKKFTVLILGGSQGAHRINTAVVDALDHLGQKEKMFFIHQTGAADEALVQTAYGQKGATGRVQAFFTDMATQYQAADLVICRAGATTIAELTAIGKGVVFIPYPFAADDHQAKNAQGLASQGAAEMILEKDLSGRGLAERIGFYMARPDALNTMAAKAVSFGRPDAADRIVEDCYRLLAA
jgi:UDP-N-acetylglucosamine--N-acetylmuramyl-(pentapeptide) pyrophosphoryl-undecaprenol N-acetylglucosamine transferase